MEQVFDLAIIGGGINGCGCAADAAMRGLSVILCEQNDIASKTSSSSSKLIHGGLRYLEQYDFLLVKKALDEQEILQKIAPHLIHPLAFILPHVKKNRPLWLLRLGLFIYDHLSRTNSLPNSKFVSRKKNPNFFLPLVADIQYGFKFFDCMTDDARLTLANAIQAREHGATILNQTKLIEAKIVDGCWILTLKNERDEFYEIKAKAVINATGPWVDSVRNVLQAPQTYKLSLVKGSHMVIHKLYDGDHAYILQNNDKRIIFAIPYHEQTLIGTTDVVFDKALDEVCMSPEEITYLGDLIKKYFNYPFQKHHIISTWSGVRPLLSSLNPQKPSELSRDYVCSFTTSPAACVTVYGGKITTYRQLAQEAINHLQDIFPHLLSSRTNSVPLPGACYKHMDFAQYQTYALEKYHWLDEATLGRYLKTYGTLTESILIGCSSVEDLGICFAPTLYQVEVDYLVREEWAKHAEDILCRRTKLGLTFDPKVHQDLNEYILTKALF